jgi:hypothetical protein
LVLEPDVFEPEALEPEVPELPEPVVPEVPEPPVVPEVPEPLVEPAPLCGEPLVFEPEVDWPGCVADWLPDWLPDCEPELVLGEPVLLPERLSWLLAPLLRSLVLPVLPLTEPEVELLLPFAPLLLSMLPDTLPLLAPGDPVPLLPEPWIVVDEDDEDGRRS